MATARQNFSCTFYCTSKRILVYCESPSFDRRSFSRSAIFHAVNIKEFKHQQSSTAAKTSLLCSAPSSITPHKIVHNENASAPYPSFEHKHTTNPLNLITWRFSSSSDQVCSFVQPATDSIEFRQGIIIPRLSRHSSSPFPLHVGTFDPDNRTPSTTLQTSRKSIKPRIMTPRSKVHTQTTTRIKAVAATFLRPLQTARVLKTPLRRSNRYHKNGLVVRDTTNVDHTIAELSYS